MKRKILIESIALSEATIPQLVLKSDVSVKQLRLLLWDARRTGQVIVWTIADREWPRTRY